MSAPATLQVLDAHWATILGCRVDEFNVTQTLVVAHGPQLADHRGAVAFRHGPSCILSVPTPLVTAIAPAIRGRAPHQVFDRDLLAGLFGVAVERVIGPAWQGYTDATDFRPAGTRGTRLLEDGDADALRLLRTVCGATAWEHSGLQIGQPHTFGCFVGDALVAAGSLTADGETCLAVGVLTHPAARGQGYVRAVASAMTAHGLAKGRMLRYQTLCANAPALAVACARGYAHYATTLAVRLDMAR